jgi:predicted enzyme related to lactoylglutathione lyase
VAELRLGWPVWIGVVTEDFDGQRRFYREVLGFSEGEVSEGYAEYDMGDGRKFEILARDASSPQYAERRYQVGFQVEDIHAAAEELEARGVDRISGIEGGPESKQYWCYFRDPEGNVFEIAQPLR